MAPRAPLPEDLTGWWSHPDVGSLRALRIDRRGRVLLRKVVDLDSSDGRYAFMAIEPAILRAEWQRLPADPR